MRKTKFLVFIIFGSLYISCSITNTKPTKDNAHLNSIKTFTIFASKDFASVNCLAYSNKRNDLFISFNTFEKIKKIEQWNVDTKKLVHTYHVSENEDEMMLQIINDKLSKMLVTILKWKNNRRMCVHYVLDYDKMHINTKKHFDSPYEKTMNFSECRKFMKFGDDIYDINGDIVDKKSIELKDVKWQSNDYKIENINEDIGKGSPYFIVTDKSTGNQIVEFDLSYLKIHGFSRNSRFFYAVDCRTILVFDVLRHKEIYRYSCDLDIDNEIRKAIFDDDNNRIMFVEWFDDGFSPVKAIQLPK